MQAQWLIREGRDQLLLFCNGWGMDGRPFQRLDSARYDVLMLYDYRDLCWPELELRSYHRRDLLAWSLGVWAAGQVWQAMQPLAFAGAVNGTLQPIGREHGIDPLIFESTLERMRTGGLRSFYHNMFTCAEDFEAFCASRPERPLAGQVEELIRLRDGIRSAAPSPAVFQAAFIGGRDIIVPARKQLRFWKDRARVRTAKTGHFPFFLWRQWEEIVDELHAEQNPHLPAL